LFVEDLVNDPTKKDLLKELLNNGQISNEMKKKIVDEIAKKPIDPSTLLNVLQNSKEIPPELLEKVLKTVENMSAKELNELAKKLDTLPPGMKQRVMKEMMKNIQDLDSKTQANILREMLRNSVDMDPKVISDLIVKLFYSTKSINS
jgi:F0F1-type ATP synthase delta subunit